jgi:small nuclear ribonucleoprotein (snRNP)-like protein|tara:strand:+ start:307 stop:669 length:363 start_codon:yes stop_codon:yes gene_type:complete
MYEKITSENIVMFAIKHYNNPQCEGEKEFYDDMKRFKYIKRLLRKHNDSGVLKERLLLNHIIILNNLFGPEACVTLLLFKVQREYWGTLKSFLLFLNILRDDELQSVEENIKVLEILRKL